MYRLQKILRNLTPFQAAGLFFLLLLAGNLPFLTYPPYWDDLLGLHRQALFLARHHFNCRELAASGDFWSGGAWIYKLNWPSAVYGMLYSVLPPGAVHVAGHILTCLLTAVSAGLVFRILRNGGTPPGIALLWGMALICEPLISTQSAGLGQEIMLIACLTAFLAAFQDRQHRRCGFWLIAAALVKPAAAVPAAAWGIVLGLDFLRKRSRASLLRVLSAGMITLGIALMLCLDSDGAAETVQFNVPARLRSMASAFPLVLVLATAGLAGGIRSLIREGRDAETMLYLIWTLLFFAGYFSYSVPLPRYAAAVVPVLILLTARSFRKSAPAALLMILAGLIMQNGTGYPPIDGPHRHSGEFLERNRQVLRQVELDREMCAFLEKHAANRPVTAKWPYIQMLADPGFGYVKKAFDRLYCAGIVPKDLKNVKEYTGSGLEKSPDVYYIFVCNSFEFFRDFGPPLMPVRGDIPVWMPESSPGYCLIYRKGVK